MSQGATLVHDFTTTSQLNPKSFRFVGKCPLFMVYFNHYNIQTSARLKKNTHDCSSLLSLSNIVFASNDREEKGSFAA